MRASGRHWRRRAGKVMFLMDQRPVGPVYLEGHPSLRGRIIFTNAEAGQADAAFTEENEGSQENRRFGA